MDSRILAIMASTSPPQPLRQWLGQRASPVTRNVPIRGTAMFVGVNVDDYRNGGLD